MLDVESIVFNFFFFFSSRRRHTRLQGDWSSDVCSSDLGYAQLPPAHWAIFSARTGDLKIQRYWTPPYEDQPLSTDEQPLPQSDDEWKSRSEERRVGKESRDYRAR